MTGRTIRIGDDVEGAADLGIVLDPTWSPGPADPPSLRPVRAVTADVLRVHDPLRRSMELLDAWAAETGVVERLRVDGWSRWYPRRLHLWRALHDRLIWRWAIASLEREGPIDRLVLAARVAEIGDVARIASAAGGWTVEEPPPEPAPPTSPSAAPRRHLPWPIDPVLWRLGLHPNQRVGRGGNARGAGTTDVRALAARLHDRAGMRAPLVLTAPATHQTVARGGAAVVADPFLGPVVDDLRRRGVDPTILELGRPARLDPRRAAVIPGGALARLYDDPSDAGELSATALDVGSRFGAASPPLPVDGLDLGPWLGAALREYLEHGLLAELRNELRIRRFLAALRPSALLTINEYSRPEWIAEASRAGIPVVAVQHGIIHPRHAGYILPTRDGLPLAGRTYLFGSYEADLLTGSSVYRPDEVSVAGAPRLDRVRTAAPAGAPRNRIRAELGVQPGARMLVFSSTSSTATRATVFAAALDALLDAPWPDVHLVVKLHPAEDDGEAFYRALIGGLARSRGFEAPALSVVKAIDLFELLGAADAHLGVSSTVLTDAVAAGVPNLIAGGFEGVDLIGYVGAGVAQPVQAAADLLAALADPDRIRPTAAARAAFLAEHFAPGPSGPAIADGLLQMAGSAPG